MITEPFFLVNLWKKVRNVENLIKEKPGLLSGTLSTVCDMASPYLSVYCGHESLVESEKYMKFSSELFEEDMLLFADFTESLFPEVDL